MAASDVQPSNDVTATALAIAWRMSDDVTKQGEGKNTDDYLMKRAELVGKMAWQMILTSRGAKSTESARS